MIKALALAGNGAGDLIVVKVDVDLVTVLVEEGVKYFCFSVLFHNC